MELCGTSWNLLKCPRCHEFNRLLNSHYPYQHQPTPQRLLWNESRAVPAESHARMKHALADADQVDVLHAGISNGAPEPKNQHLNDRGEN